MIGRFRFLAYALGVSGFCLFGVVVVLLPDVMEERLSASGPSTPGHEELSCVDCHAEGPGTTRQQLQGIVSYYTGFRDSAPFLGHLPVSNARCIDCHPQLRDLHPVYRFEEVRFAEARQEFSAHQCGGCHAEHEGVRVSQPGDFCESCHSETTLKNDPATPSHAVLIEEASWSSCLRCHDFHGNHDHTPPENLQEALPLPLVQQHLKAAPAGLIYGDRVETTATLETR